MVRLIWWRRRNLKFPKSSNSEVRIVQDGGSRGWLGWIVAAAAVVLALSFWFRPSDLPDPPLTRFTVVGLGGDRNLSFIDQPILAFSPDGRTLAMTATDPDSARDVIDLRHLDQNEVGEAGGTEGARRCFFPPMDRRSPSLPTENSRLSNSAVRGDPGRRPDPARRCLASDGTILFAPSTTPVCRG